MDRDDDHYVASSSGSCKRCRSTPYYSSRQHFLVILQLGGLGGRNDISEKATVVLTSYQAEGFRPIWVRNTIEMYCSEEYRVVVDRVILLWNNPDVPPPSNLASCAIVVSPPVNSLNNRWIATLPYIRTKAILNLDDDVTVTKVNRDLQKPEGQSLIILPSRRMDCSAYSTTSPRTQHASSALSSAVTRGASM